ncbi:hypothetical protein C0Z18_29625 [Trinickia dabaoshanensis]|uniref:YncE family protein n=1 Tax=Trinickia dabaoshanensis TaxID=564714 RepID=A0A2N7VCS0_9BURK|nr:hypothetical protein C0Z18_29625 [Trinickia dabaoshanensis]
MLASRAPSAADSGPSHDLPLKHVADVVLPGGPTRLDYESLDPTRHLLFIAHLGDGDVIAFDVRSQRVVARIENVADVHGVLAVPALGRVYASATGSNEVVAIDDATMKIVARMPAGAYPDGMAYAPDEMKLYVSDETGATETVIDTRTNARIATVDLGGEAGNTQYDPVSRHVFVNVQTRNELAEIDPATDRIVRRIALRGGRHNHGLLIDDRDRFAFVGCDGDDKLLVLDMRSLRIVASLPVGKDPDVLAFDSRASVLYVAGESGTVSMFSVKPSGLTEMGSGRLAPNAHVVAVDEATHQVYFPLKNVDDRPVLRIMAPSP